MPTMNGPGFSTEGLDLTARQLNYLLQIKDLIGVECYSPAVGAYETNIYLIWDGRIRLVPGSRNLHLMCFHRGVHDVRWTPPRSGMATMHRRLTPVEEL